MSPNAKTKSAARWKIGCELHRRIKRDSKKMANRIERRALNRAAREEC